MTMFATWPDGDAAPILVVGVEDREIAPGPDSWTRFGFASMPHWREARPEVDPKPDVVLDVSGAPAFLVGDVHILQLDGDSLHENWLPTVRLTGSCLVGLNLNSNPHLAWATVKV